MPVLSAVSNNNNPVPRTTVDAYNQKFYINLVRLDLLRDQVYAEGLLLIFPMTVRSLYFSNDYILKDHKKYWE